MPVSSTKPPHRFFYFPVKRAYSIICFQNLVVRYPKIHTIRLRGETAKGGDI